MNTEQISVFLEVAKTGSFSKAADMLYKTQPGVSRIISSLESELGTQLFIRQPHKKNELTDSGHLYFDVFTHFSDELEKAAEACRVMQIEGSTLRLGHAPFWNTSCFLPLVYQAIGMAESPVSISVECHEFGELSRRVYEGYLDMAITVDQNSINDYNLDSVYLCPLPKVIVYSKSLCSESTEVNTAFFENKDFLLYNHPHFSAQKHAIQEMEGFLGFRPNVKGVVNVDSLNSQVLAGQGVIVLDNWSQQLLFNSLGYFPLNAEHEVLLIFRKDTKFRHLINNIIICFSDQ